MQFSRFGHRRSDRKKIRNEREREREKEKNEKKNWLKFQPENTIHDDLRKIKVRESVTVRTGVILRNYALAAHYSQEFNRW